MKNSIGENKSMQEFVHAKISLRKNWPIICETGIFSQICFFVKIGLLFRKTVVCFGSDFSNFFSYQQHCVPNEVMRLVVVEHKTKLWKTHIINSGILSRQGRKYTCKNVKKVIFFIDLIPTTYIFSEFHAEFHWKIQLTIIIFAQILSNFPLFLKHRISLGQFYQRQKFSQISWIILRAEIFTDLAILVENRENFRPWKFLTAKISTRKNCYL